MGILEYIEKSSLLYILGILVACAGFFLLVTGGLPIPGLDYDIFPLVISATILIYGIVLAFIGYYYTGKK
jgi:hypothetical protein